MKNVIIKGNAQPRNHPRRALRAVTLREILFHKRGRSAQIICMFFFFTDGKGGALF